jgi:hypothetical protein
MVLALEAGEAFVTCFELGFEIGFDVIARSLTL